MLQYCAPSFYRADVVHNPSGFERWRSDLRQKMIGWLQARRAGSRLDFSGSLTVAVEEQLAPKAPDPQLGGIIKLAVMAVGGQGGGVLTNWIESLARSEGFVCQATLGCRRGAAHGRNDLLR